MDWERRRILVWGKTRPEISTKYREVVCTGGVFADTGRLVRLYPIPLRFLDDERNFKKYQWIEADVRRESSDSRPESYRIRAEGIEVGQTISTGPGSTWRARAQWVLRPGNTFPSVESLQDGQRENGTSLGVVKPAEILKVSRAAYSLRERDQFWKRYRDVLSQQHLDYGERQDVKPLSPPDFRFRVQFRCSDPRCEGHEFGVLDWELDSLYFKLRRKGNSEAEAADKVVAKLSEVCSPSRDTRFFLGNISNHPQVFTIVGLWWPNAEDGTQPVLFD